MKSYGESRVSQCAFDFEFYEFLQFFLGWNFPDWKNLDPLKMTKTAISSLQILQNWFHVKSDWQEILHFPNCDTAKLTEISFQFCPVSFFCFNPLCVADGCRQDFYPCLPGKRALKQHMCRRSALSKSTCRFGKITLARARKCVKYRKHKQQQKADCRGR